MQTQVNEIPNWVPSAKELVQCARAANKRYQRDPDEPMSANVLAQAEATRALIAERARLFGLQPDGAAERGSPTLAECQAVVNAEHAKYMRSECDSKELGFRIAAAVRTLCLQSQPVPTTTDADMAVYESVFEQASGLTLNALGEVQDAWGDVRAGLRAVLATRPQITAQPVPTSERDFPAHYASCAWNDRSIPGSPLCTCHETHPPAKRPASPSSFGERLTKLAEMEARVDKLSPSKLHARAEKIRSDVVWAGNPEGVMPRHKGIALAVEEVRVELNAALRNSWPAIRAALGRSGEGDRVTLPSVDELSNLADTLVGDDRSQRGMAGMRRHLVAHLEAQGLRVVSSDAPQRAEPGEREAALEEAAKFCFDYAEGATQRIARAVNDLVRQAEINQRDAAWFIGSHLRSLKSTPSRPAPTAGSAETSAEN